MDSDNLMPNDGTYFLPREPKDQILARQQENAKAIEVQPVLEKLVEDYKRDIEFYGSVDAMPAECKTDPKKFLIVHNANEMTRDALRSKMEYIQSLIDKR